MKSAGDPPKSGALDRRLKALGNTLANDDSRQDFTRKVKRLVRFLLALPATGYGLLLLLLIIALRFVGESNMTIAFFLYVPRVIFLLPALVILPIALIFHWRSGLFILACSIAFFIWGMGWEFGSAPKPVASVPGNTLTVLTNNRGQHLSQSLQPFMRAMDPDIIVLQDAPLRAPRYANAKGYEKYTHTHSEAEFTVLSCYPILSSSPVNFTVGSHQHIPPAARFVIDFEGTEISLFTVHTLSPRDTLSYYRFGSFIYGVIGLPGTPWKANRVAGQKFWDDRILQARQLHQIMLKDPLPTVIAGDFNAPSGGLIHSIFCDGFRDAHLESGHGFGYSFPGSTRNPLSKGGPWMRIDYLFCDQEWQPIWCITEEKRPSQHRAVAAQFRLQ